MIEMSSCRNAIICASKFKREDTMVKHIILWNFGKKKLDVSEKTSVVES